MNVHKITDDDLALVKRLWLEGKSASEIGKVINRTRNAVIGYCHRHGWTRDPSINVAARIANGRANGGFKGVFAPKPAKLKQSHRHNDLKPRLVVAGNGAVLVIPPDRAPRAVAKDVAPAIGSVGLRIVDAGFGGCRWPIDGTSDETRFCCLPREAGRVYCDHHHAAAVAPVQPTARELIRGTRRYA